MLPPPRQPRPPPRSKKRRRRNTLSSRNRVTLSLLDLLISEDNMYSQVPFSMSKTSDLLLSIDIFVVFESDTDLLKPLSVRGRVEVCSKCLISWLPLADWQLSSSRGIRKPVVLRYQERGKRLSGSYVNSCLSRQYRSAISGGSWTSESSLRLWNIRCSRFLNFFFLVQSDATLLEILGWVIRLLSCWAARV